MDRQSRYRIHLVHLVNDSFQPSSPSVNAGATQPSRLGVYLEGDGVDIAVTAPNAQAVEVCFFTSGEPTAQETRYRLLGPTDGIWHGHVAGITAGTCYGFRAWGPVSYTHLSLPIRSITLTDFPA